MLRVSQEQFDDHDCIYKQWNVRTIVKWIVCILYCSYWERKQKTKSAILNWQNRMACCTLLRYFRPTFSFVIFIFRFIWIVAVLSCSLLIMPFKVKKNKLFPLNVRFHLKLQCHEIETDFTSSTLEFSLLSIFNHTNEWIYYFFFLFLINRNE